MNEGESTMRLYFFRHGIAQDNTGGRLPDHQRQLTLKGAERVRQAARVMKALDIQPDRLFSSPLIRARQTADIIGQALGVAVQVRDELGWDFSQAMVEVLTRDLGDDAEVMFVGHEPTFSETISSLIGGGSVEMKKGGLARVDIFDYQPMRGTLVWLIAPRVFEQLT